MYFPKKFSQYIVSLCKRHLAIVLFFYIIIINGKLNVTLAEKLKMYVMICYLVNLAYDKVSLRRVSGKPDQAF
jgi:hypothetical protein